MKALLAFEQGSISLSNFLLAILLARFLGLEQFGLFATIWLIVLFVNSLHQASIVFPMMSMNESITRSSQYRDGLDLMQLLFIILAIVLFLLIYLALNYLVPLGIDLVIPSALAMVSYHYHDYIRKILILDNERVKLLYFTITGYFSRFILFGFLYLFDISIELTVVFIVLIVSYILSFLVILQKIKFGKKSQLIDVFYKHWQTSQWLIPSGILQWFSANYYMIIAAIVISPVAVAAIRIGQNIAQLINVALLASENYLPIKAAKEYEDNCVKGLTIYIKKVASLFLIPVTLLIIMAIMFSEYIVEAVYGLEFVPYSFTLIWFSIMAFTLVLMSMLRTYFRVVSNTKPWFVGYVTSSVFALIFAYPLEANYGVHGALLGMLISQVIVILGAYLYSKRMLNESR